MKILRDDSSRSRINIKSIERVIMDYSLDKIVIMEIKLKLNSIREAARMGSVLAEACLGHLFDSGIGVRKDLTKAVFWYQIAGRHNNAHAQSWLGYAYANGAGVKKNLAKALFWDRKAARQGYAVAQYNLGQAYAEGLGINQNV